MGSAQRLGLAMGDKAKEWSSSRTNLRILGFSLILLLLILAGIVQLLRMPTEDGDDAEPSAVDLTYLFNPHKAPSIDTVQACLEASGGFVNKGEPDFESFAKWLGLDETQIDLVLNRRIDVTSVETLAQLLAPDARLVLDPMLFLRTAEGIIGSAHGMPKLIHMTMHTKRTLPPHQVLSILSWGKLHPGYTLLLYDDHDMATYMRQYSPSFLHSYYELRTPVEKADAWRYHVLCNHGGVYTDSDTLCTAPVEAWMQFAADEQEDLPLVEAQTQADLEVGGTVPDEDKAAVAEVMRSDAPALVVGIDNRFRTQVDAQRATYVRRMQMAQWTVAARHGHPMVCGMGDAISRFMEQEFMAAEDRAAAGEPMSLEDEVGHDASILLRTGPGIWTDEVSRYLNKSKVDLEDLAEGGRAADVLVLPQTSFGCSFRFWRPENTAPFVYHMFNNSWKSDSHMGLSKLELEHQQHRQAVWRHNLLQQVLTLLAILCCIIVFITLARSIMPALLKEEPALPKHKAVRRGPWAGRED